MDEKREQEDINSLAEWVKDVRSLTLQRMEVLSRSMNVNVTSVFQDPDVTKTLSTIDDKYVVGQADKAKNNIVLSAKRITSNVYYVDVENNSSNRTYTSTILSKDEIVENLKCAIFWTFYQRR